MANLKSILDGLKSDQAKAGSDVLTLTKDFVKNTIPLLDSKVEDQITLLKMWYNENKDSTPELIEILALIPTSPEKREFILSDKEILQRAPDLIIETLTTAGENPPKDKFYFRDYIDDMTTPFSVQTLQHLMSELSRRSDQDMEELHDNQRRLAESWFYLHRNATPNMNINIVSVALDYINVDDSKVMLVNKYFKDLPEGSIDVSETLKLFTKIDSIYEKVNLAQAHEELKNSDINELIVFLSSNTIIDEPGAFNLCSYIKELENPFSVETLNYLLDKSENVNVQYDFIKAWAELDQNPTYEQIKEISSHLKEIDYDKLEMILVTNEHNDEIKIKHFIFINQIWQANHLNEELNLYEIQSSFRRYFRFDKEPTKQYIMQICKQLFPNSIQEQIELMKNCLLDSNMINKDVLLNMFTSSLQDNDMRMNVIQFALDREITVKPMEHIEYLGAINSIDPSFESLKSLLNEVTISEAIRPGAFPEIEEFFKKGFHQDLKLIALFSYCKAKGNMADFGNMLKPAIFNRIKETYQPPTGQVFITSEDHDKAIDLGVIKADVNEFPRIGLICQYLKKRENTFLKIPPIEKSLVNIAILSHANKSDNSPEMELKRKFLKIMSKGTNASAEEIRNYFEEVTGLPLKHQESKLKLLFEYRAKELAYLFSKPDGISNYINLIHSIGDGCAANIGTKTNIYILGKLFTNPIDKIVYPIYIEKIFNPIVNSADDILGASIAGVNILNHPAIVNLCISPRGLVAALENEIMQAPTLSNELLEKLLTRPERDNYAVNIYGEDEKMQASVASYLILREILPKDEWNSPVFDFIKNKAEAIIKDPEATLKSDFPKSKFEPDHS